MFINNIIILTGNLFLPVKPQITFEPESTSLTFKYASEVDLKGLKTVIAI